MTRKTITHDQQEFDALVARARQLSQTSAKVVIVALSFADAEAVYSVAKRAEFDTVTTARQMHSPATGWRNFPVVIARAGSILAVIR